MSLTAKQTGGADFAPIPEGTYTAVCYAVVDLGTHTNPKFDKVAHKVLIQWEIPEETIQVERNGEMVDMPRAISKKYTMSLHTKATLRHDLEAWRGKAFTEAELDGFDVSKLAGAQCLMCVVHEPSKDGSKVYANIKSIMAPPKGSKKIKPVNPVVVFEIPDDAAPGFEIPESDLPEWIVELIRESHEWKGTAQGPIRPTADESHRADEDDPLPF